MKAIETVYDGYRFRSRLEARWAVFFDTLGIKWEYEKEGFDLDGVRYLPDFWLPEHDCFWEVKGKEPTREELYKCMLLALHSNKPVYLACGAIWLPGLDDTYEEYYDEEKLYHSQTVKKGAYGFDPVEVSLTIDDTTSPCYHKRCLHHEEKKECPSHLEVYPPGTLADEQWGTFHIKPEQGHLIRAVYQAEVLVAAGDSCKLRVRNHSLEFITPTYGDVGKMQYRGRIPAPLPSPIKQYEQEFLTMLSAKPDHWEWGAGAVGILYSETDYRWHQCDCGVYGILAPRFTTSYIGNGSKYPCGHSEDRYDLEESDRTPRLIAAYTAARQARFEHGEHG